ncbi:MAG: DUF3592 domain-containing protein [Acidobacteriota bacterium]
MAAAIALLVIAAGAIAAGAGYVRAARRMTRFARTRGRVIAREVVPLPSVATREGVFGRGGGHMPKVTYRYEVAGVAHTSDRLAYANEGLKQSVAEAELAKIPDEVEVWYDPGNPSEAYLRRHSPALGIVLVGGGLVVAAFDALYLLVRLLGRA